MYLYFCLHQVAREFLEEMGQTCTVLDTWDAFNWLIFKGKPRSESISQTEARTDMVISRFPYLRATPTTSEDFVLKLSAWK